MSRSTWIRLLALVAFVALGVFVASRFRLNAQMTRFLPGGSAGEASSLSGVLADSAPLRTMILNLRSASGDEAATREAARRFVSLLEATGGFTWIHSGVDAHAEQAFHELYFPRRYLFMSETPEVLELGASEVRARVEALKRQLSLPSGALFRNLAAADPLGVFGSQLERFLAAESAELRVVDGQFLTRDGHAVVFVGFAASAFEAELQRPLLDTVERVRQRVEAELGAPLRLEATGVNRFALEAETRIRADVQFVSALATLGGLLVFLLFFPSISYLLSSLVPLLGGTLCAAAATLLWFGELHAVTVAFGAALLGVCIDFPIHYLGHHSLAPSATTPHASMARVRPALLLGASTTVLGLAGLAWTSFPGIREIAVFTSVGVVAALAVTLFVLPELTPRQRAHRPLALLATGLARALAAIAPRRRWLWLLPGLVAVLAATAWPKLRWQNSMQELTRQSPALREEDARVRGRVSATESGRVVVAVGSELEQALERNDAAHAVLAQAAADGLLASHQSLHTWLWSRELQERNRRAVLGRPELEASTLAELEAQGFEAKAFEGFLEDARSAPALSFDELSSSPLRDLVRNFVVETEDRVLLLSFVRDVRDADALAQRLGALPGVHYIDQARLLDRAYVEFRQRTVELVAVGALVVFAMLLGTYRSLRWTLAAFLPALVGSVTALALIVHLGEPLNLFHVLVSLLVLSIGEDYGVFLVETARHPAAGHHAGGALASIALAAASTALSFGALALSSEPALRAIGQTAGLGVAMCFVLAPVALLLSTEGSKRRVA